MNALSYSHARANLAKTIDRVVEDHAPVLITRKGEGAVVMISQADYSSLEETAYLLKSPANARRLLESIEQVNRGEHTVRELIDD